MGGFLLKFNIHYNFICTSTFLYSCFKSKTRQKSMYTQPKIQSLHRYTFMLVLFKHTSFCQHVPTTKSQWVFYTQTHTTQIKTQSCLGINRTASNITQGDRLMNLVCKYSFLWGIGFSPSCDFSCLQHTNVIIYFTC